MDRSMGWTRSGEGRTTGRGRPRRNRRALRRYRPAYLLLGLAVALAACSKGETRGTSPELSWDLPEDPSGLGDYLLDFSLVAVGSTATRTVAIRNDGSVPLALRPQAPSAPFSLRRAGEELNLGAGAAGELIFSFAPLEEMERPAHTLLTIETNESSHAAGRTIRLVGQGVAPSLRCTPALLDFGVVLLGRGETRTLECVNELDTRLEVLNPEVRGNHRGSFNARLVGAGDAPLVVEPLGTVSLEVDFEALVLGQNDATVRLRDAGEQPLVEVALRGEGVSSALRPVSPACLDFGTLSKGESVRRPLALQNIGTKDLQITQVELQGRDGGSFSVEADLPISVPAGSEPIELSLVFHPQVEGEHLGELVITSSDGTDSKTITACLRGAGGGPKLVCEEGPLDFGMVALGLPMARSFRCLNDGALNVGGVDSQLYVEAVGSDSSVFSATVRNEDSSVGIKPGGYAVAESFVVEVVYSPLEERFDTGTIRVETHAGTAELAAAGQGRDLPPCDFELEPPALQFGILERGDSLTQSFGVINRGEESCLIGDLKLAEGSDPSFSLTPISSAEILPGETFRVPVAFAPTSYQSPILGRVSFQLSSEGGRFHEVPLRGSSAEPCLLLRPIEVDFGKAKVGCETRAHTVVVSNVCGTDLTIGSVEINAALASDEFQILSRPSLPVVVRSGRLEEFTVSYTPKEVGDSQGTVAIGVEGFEEAHLARLIGSGVLDGMQTDEFLQPPQLKSDILWIIDNSTSFDPFQTLIGNNLPAFLTYAKSGDFRIAVTTSGLDRIEQSWGSPCTGGADGGENGRFFPIDGSHPRILDPQTPNLEDHWRHNMAVGACHILEEPIEAALRALSPPLINEVKDSRYPNSPYNDGNAGFLRNDADLAIIFVTDQMDHSWNHSPQEYLQLFRAIKGPGRANKLKFHAITIPASWTGLPGCGGFPEERSDRIMYLVEETGGTWVNLCGSESPEAWAEGMKEMSQGTFGFSSSFALKGIPGDRNGDQRVDVRDLEVHIDGEKLEPNRSGAAVWTYNPVENRVVFTPLFIPKPGSKISVTYEIACQG